MWELPGQKNSRFNRRKKEPAKVDAAAGPKTKFHMRRTSVELVLREGFGQGTQTFTGRVILNEVTPAGLYLYSTEPFFPGQEISLTLEQPRRFFARGRVISCSRADLNSRVFSTKPFPYRLAVVFDCQNVNETAAIEKYCSELHSQYLAAAI